MKPRILLGNEENAGTAYLKKNVYQKLYFSRKKIGSPLFFKVQGQDISIDGDIYLKDYKLVITDIIPVQQQVMLNTCVIVNCNGFSDTSVLEIFEKFPHIKLLNVIQLDYNNDVKVYTYISMDLPPKYKANPIILKYVLNVDIDYGINPYFMCEAKNAFDKIGESNPDFELWMRYSEIEGCNYIDQIQYVIDNKSPYIKDRLVNSLFYLVEEKQVDLDSLREYIDSFDEKDRDYFNELIDFYYQNKHSYEEKDF